MKTRSLKIIAVLSRRILLTGMALLVAGQSARAANGNGTPDYIDVNGNTAGFGTPSGTINDNSANWDTTAAGTGTPAVWVSNDQMTFGAVSTDLAGATFTVGLTISSDISGIVVNSASANITLTGTGNNHLNNAFETFAVTNGSTLTFGPSLNRQSFDGGGTGQTILKGMNFNNVSVNLTGGGIYNFQTPLGVNCNASTAPWTNSMLSTGVINIDIANTAPIGAGTYICGFVQNSGTLNFESAGAANIFYGFTAGKNFAINGGIVDNTSGSPITLNMSSGGGISFGGNFTFNGSTNMSLSSAPVTLTATPTITINANTLTVGGVISGTGNGITLAGNGILDLTNANLYTGATTVNGGVLEVGDSLASGSAVSLGAGTLCGSGTVSGSVTTTSSSAQINQETNYEISGSVSTLALGSSLNLSSGGTLSFDLGASHVSGNDKVTVAGALTLGGNTVHIKSLIGGAYMDGTGDYILIQGASAPSGSINAAPVWDGTSPANSNLFMVEVVGNNVVLHFNPGSTFAVSGASATPSSITRLQSTFLSVTVTNGTPPYTITVDTSSIGGSSSFNLVQDLNEPAGVSVFTNSIMPVNTTASGSYVLPVSATDSASDAAGSGILLTVTPLSLVWNGDAGGNSPWDTTGDTEWQGGNSFAQGDTVRFDDTASGLNATNIYIQEAVAPAAVTVSNTAARATGIYEFNNNPNNPISGATSLLKQGSGTLILDQNNTYTGATTISGGALQVGNRDGNGALGAGPVTDNGSLIFNNPGNGQVITNSISGSGSMIEEGNDNLQLAADNTTFNGSILVTSNSTLQLGAYNSLGTAVTTVITNSTLDINGYTASGSVIAQGVGTDGNGAINNRSSTIAGEAGTGGVSFVGVTNLTLSGNITLGAVNGRWDLRNPGSTGGNPAVTILSTGGQPYNIIKVGSQLIGIVAATVDTNLANIDVQGGIFDMEGNTTGLGNPTNTLTIEGTLFGSDGTFQMYAITNRLNKIILVNDGGTLQAANGNDTVIGPVTFTNSSGSATPNCTVNVSGTTLNLAGQIYGNGILYQNIGTNTLILTATDTNFAGSVVVNEGKLVVSNILSTVGGVNVNFAASLYVDGAIGGPGVTNNASGNVIGSGIVSNVLDNFGNVDPGTPAAPATLTVGGLIFENGCSPTFNLNYNSTIGGGVNDLIAVKGNLTLNGGTITINPVGTILQDGVSYTLITYTGACNVPMGLVTSGLSINGVNNYNFAITNTGSAITITPSGGPPIWNGGASPYNFWDNATNWGGVALSGNDALTFGGTVGLNNTNDETSESAQSITFLSTAGAFTLNASNGVSLTLNGNILNQSTAAQTINIPLNIGGSAAFNGASGTLIIGGAVTNTAGTTSVNALTLMGSGVLTDLLYSANSGTNLLTVSGASANWTLVDNPSSTPISGPWALEMTNGTLTVGNAGSAPNFTSTTFHNAPLDSQMSIASGSLATLNMVNGTLAINTLNTAPSVNSTSIVNVTGGTLNIGPVGGTPSDYFQGANGANTGEVSTVTISGGSMNLSSAGAYWIASRGSGSLTMSGTGSLLCGTFDLSRDADGNAIGSVGVVNLNGGAITCNHVGTADANSQAGPPTIGPSPSATFNFNGGILRAGNSSATFYQGNTASPAIPIASFVLAGGAFLDTSNWAITVLEPLQSGANPDGGLTVLGTGTLTLARTNSYNGPTTIASSSTLALTAPTGNGITGTGRITIAGGAAFNVSGLASGFTLASGQVLSNSTSTAAINGSLNATAGKLGLTYAAGTPSLSVTNGQLTLAAGTALNINNTGAALPVGVYAIITNFTGGSVIGTVPSSFTVSGGGTAAGQPTSLQISGGALDLVVGLPAKPAVFTGISVNGATLTITATNGAVTGQFVLLESTNLLLPINQWTPILTNSFNGSGNLNLSTNIINPASPAEFYLLQMP